MFRYQKILVPLDGSVLAERALAPAVALANAMAATVVLLRVVPALIRDIYAERYKQIALEVGQEQVDSYLRAVRLRLSPAAVPISTATVQGPVAESIIDYGMENDVDLIAMCSHGHSGISRWLGQVHGDFHPFNVLFGEGNDFTLIDRSRGQWGEPADDVSCMAINYLFFSLQRDGRLSEPFTSLYTAFWETYLSQTQDDEVRAVIAPWFAWRALVLASPHWCLSI